MTRNRKKSVNESFCNDTKTGIMKVWHLWKQKKESSEMVFKIYISHFELCVSCIVLSCSFMFFHVLSSWLWSSSITWLSKPPVSSAKILMAEESRVSWWVALEVAVAYEINAVRSKATWFTPNCRCCIHWQSWDFLMSNGEPLPVCIEMIAPPRAKLWLSSCHQPATFNHFSACHMSKCTAPGAVHPGPGRWHQWAPEQIN